MNLQTDNRLCARCGRQVRATARFCPHCGIRLTGVREATQGPGLPIPTAWPKGVIEQVLWAPGTRLGDRHRYKIERLLGRGGFGEAYLAHDTRLDRPCVVKRLSISSRFDEATRLLLAQNFEREALLLATLNTPGHPNIPEIYEYLDDQHALVMKFIAGQSLASLLDSRGGRLPLPEALRHTLAICDALAYMHGRPEPVLHRDIKPSNILLDSTGRVWLIDFGLARALSVGLPETLDSEQSQSAGTLGYTPPEQWLGRSEARSDIYALVATLYRMLAGITPEQTELRAMAKGLAVPSLQEMVPDLPSDLEWLMRRGLDPDPSARPLAQELADGIAAVLRRLETPPPEPVRPPATGLFVGRDHELADLRARLATEGVALISGLAGVGKTMLAAALARTTEEPIFWHSFREAEGFDVLSRALAAFLAYNGQDGLWRQLQVASQPGGQLPPPDVASSYLVQLLRDLPRQAEPPLICLDDLHFATDDPQVEMLVERLLVLAQEGAARLLITARGLPPFLEQYARPPLAGLSTEDTGRLAAVLGLALEEPLRNELHAATEGNAQLLLLAVEALRQARDPARLIGRLAETRQIERYLLREVDARLSANERRVMGAVAVLLGVPGNRGVLGALLDDTGVRRLLASLADRCLLTVEEREEGLAYGQNAIVRAFYYDQLEAEERRIMHLRATNWYAIHGHTLLAARHAERSGDLARAADLATADLRALINGGEARALHLLLSRLVDAQLDSLRRLAVTIACGEVETLLRESEAAQKRFRAALALLDTLPDTPETRAQRARTCRGMGELLEVESPHEALEWLRNGLAALHDPSGAEEGALQLRIGSALVATGDYAGAEQALLLSMRLLPDDQRSHRADALNNLGIVYSSRGEVERGRDCYRQALAMYRQTDNTWGTLSVRHNLAIELEVAGDWEAAAAEYTQAQDLAQTIGDAVAWTSIELSLGMLETNRSNDALAETHLTRCLSLAERHSLHETRICGQSALAELRLRQHAWSAAAELLAEAEQLALVMDERWTLPDILSQQARMLVATGKPELAVARASEAVEQAEALALDLEAGRARRVLGQAQLACGDSAAAEHSFAASLALLDTRDPYEAARTRAAWSYVATNHQSTELLREAAATFTRLGARRDLEEIQVAG